ncbi:glutamate receptor 2-like [Pollicipes pollicipes]|uniref:glutamate receptor 2-like n=1 Tax=Pollicipes pollicipes TaxID=41117 RepID=UPI001884D968|nr:glutamate receptor 2-like [Pollicipes pollicipes]
MQHLGQWPSTTNHTDTLVVATFHYPPYTLVDPARPNHVTGFLADLMQVLSAAIGVSVVYDTDNTPGDFGIQLENGTFTGLIGRLVSKTAHVGLAPMRWRHTRQQVVDFVGKVPIAIDKISFLVMGQPRTSMNDIGSLLTPFHTNVWLCLLGGMLLASVLLRVTVTFTRPYDLEDDRTFGIVSSLLHVYACVVQQGWSTTPCRASCRIVTLAARVLGILIYVEYSATLISVMTVLQTSTEVSSVDDFVDRSDWSLLIQPGVAYSSDWKTSKEASLRTLYERMQTGRQIKTLTPETMGQMFEPKTVTSFDRDQALIVFGERACGLVSLPMQPSSSSAQPPPRAGTPVFLVMQKHMPLKPEIDRVMQALYQTGTIKGLYNRWFWNVTNQECPSSTVVRPLAFGDLGAILFMVPAGLVLSLAVMLLEVLFMYAANCTKIQYQRPMVPGTTKVPRHQLWRMD